MRDRKVTGSSRCGSNAKGSARILPNTCSDNEMEGRGPRMVRYADDFVILCESPAEAQEAMAEVER